MRKNKWLQIRVDETTRDEFYRACKERNIKKHADFYKKGNKS